MSVEKINYEDKVGLQNDENIPNKNKVTDEDMNEIKSKVNNNADELTTAQQNIEDLQSGQGTASGDITSLKNRVTALETDNTANKQDINTLKADNETNKTNISTLQEDVEEIESNIQQIQQEQTAIKKEIQELDDNQIHITTEKSSNINVQDASGQNAKINVFGNSIQNGEPTPKAPVNIENVTGNIDITDCNKNWLKVQNSNNSSLGLNWNTSKEEIKITGIATSTYSISSQQDCEIPAGSYKFEYETNNTNLVYGIWLFNSKNQIIATIRGKNSATINETVVKYALFIEYTVANTSYNITLKAMLLNTVTEDKTFVPHQNQVVTFPLATGQKLYKGDYSADDGIHHVRKQVELDGTEAVMDSGSNETTHHFTIPFKDKKIGQHGALSNMFVNSTVATLVYSLVENPSIARITFKMPLEYTTVDSFKTFLSQQKQAGTPVIVEYELAEEEIEAYTEEQQTAYNQLQNAKTYKTVTNVFTENAEVEMEYVADTKTYVDNEINSIKEQLNTVNELLSTTKTSAMLLDNMQSDLESEVL